MKHVKTTCFFTENISLRGNLSANGSVRVDGKFEGQLVAKGTVYVGKNAQITGGIHAYRVYSQGKINGALRGEQGVRVESNSQIDGDIITGELSIDEGVHFNGSCQILPPIDNPEPLINLQTARVAIEHRED